MEYDSYTCKPRYHFVLPNLRVPRNATTESRRDAVEESGRRESFAPTYGVHINPVSKGKQIPLCSSGQGCTHEGGPFQRPPIDCTDLNYRTLKTLFSIHHQHHSYTVGPNDKTRQPKIREIN